RDLPVVFHVSGFLRHAHGGNADVDVFLHVIAMRLAGRIRSALRGGSDVRRHTGVDAENRRARIGVTVNPLIAGTGVVRAVVQIPRVDVVDADLEVVAVVQLVIEADARVDDRFAVLRVGDGRIGLRVGNAGAAGRKERRILVRGAGDVRQVRIVSGLLRE